MWVKRKLAHALLMPQIIYGLEVVFGTSERLLLRLCCIVNDVTRFVYGIRRREHIPEHVKLLLSVSFNGFISCIKTFLFYTLIKRGLPYFLCDIFSFSLSSSKTQIIIPRTYNVTFERSYLIRVARI